MRTQATNGTFVFGRLEVDCNSTSSIDERSLCFQTAQNAPIRLYDYQGGIGVKNQFSSRPYSKHRGRRRKPMEVVAVSWVLPYQFSEFEIWSPIPRYRIWTELRSRVTKLPSGGEPLARVVVVLFIHNLMGANSFWPSSSWSVASSRRAKYDHTPIRLQEKKLPCGGTRVVWGQFASSGKVRKQKRKLWLRRTYLAHTYLFYKPPFYKQP